MQKAVNSTAPKNNLFHQVYSFTTLGVAFSHLLGLTEHACIIDYCKLSYPSSGLSRLL
jgi:hypothetical protein